jgi:NAD(P)-dependent dehydrogenase (short-subunit alcohol dehydrogenase family)
MGAEFDGKKIVVVGGSAGMGRQAALDVIDRGGSAVIIGRSKERVDDTVAELTDRRGQAWGIVAELTDRSAVADVQRELSERHGDATLMVNAAGFFIPKPFLDYDAEFYDSYLDLNYALFFLTQTVVAGMVAGSTGGSIVNIGSMWAHQAIGVTPSSGYSMQKAGLHALTHNLAIELAEHQIRVNAVAPAVVKTPLYEGFIPKGRSTPPWRRSRHFIPWAASAPPPTWPTQSPSCSPNKPAGSPARFSTLMAASWPAATSTPA